MAASVSRISGTMLKWTAAVAVICCLAAPCKARKRIRRADIQAPARTRIRKSAPVQVLLDL